MKINIVTIARVVLLIIVYTDGLRGQNSPVGPQEFICRSFGYDHLPVPIPGLDGVLRNPAEFYTGMSLTKIYFNEDIEDPMKGQSGKEDLHLGMSVNYSIDDYSNLRFGCGMAFYTVKDAFQFEGFSEQLDQDGSWILFAGYETNVQWLQLAAGTVWSLPMKLFDGEGRYYFKRRDIVAQLGFFDHVKLLGCYDETYDFALTTPRLQNFNFGLTFPQESKSITASVYHKYFFKKNKDVSMYIEGGLCQKICREGESPLSEKPLLYSRLAGLAEVGPNIRDLGYFFEVFYADQTTFAVGINVMGAGMYWSKTRMGTSWFITVIQGV